VDKLPNPRKGGGEQIHSEKDMTFINAGGR
jgi:hypothetical protein